MPQGVEAQEAVLSGFIRLTSNIAHDYPLGVHVRPETVDLLIELRSGAFLFTESNNDAMVKESPAEIIAKIQESKDGPNAPASQ